MYKIEKGGLGQKKFLENQTKWRVPRLTGTKPKYRNETEIPERNIRIIGKHIQVPKWLMDNTNELSKRTLY